jgi:hypothetical protein
LQFAEAVAFKTSRDDTVGDLVLSRLELLDALQDARKQEQFMNPPPFGHNDEISAIASDARACGGKSPSERIAMLQDLLAAVDVIWSSLSAEERARRMRIYDEIHRSPHPWYRNLRPEAKPTS